MAKCATVLVAQPTAHRGDFNTRFDAAGGKQVTQIVTRDPGYPNALGRSIHRLLALLDLHHGNILGFVRPFLPQPVQQRHHVGDHREPSKLGVIGASLCVAAHRDFAFLKVAVVPSYVPGLSPAEAAKGQKPHEVGALPGIPAASRFDCLKELGELGKSRQRQLLGARADALEDVAGLSKRIPKFDDDVQRSAQSGHGVVEGCCARLAGKLGSPIEAVASGGRADVSLLQTGPPL